ncbi:RNA polymerase ECF-type sigma factor [hydrothermal vent metagenome]|uniref:RNA polymerase ECF-type sigma factor n=1 Tax=hydrothermal vent metagenome TaxID=652676 RepID=A0A3B0RGU7_9ZZZZ
MTASDLELVALVVATRDQRAFSQLVTRYEVLIRAMLVRMTGNHALADDLAQDTFLRAWNKIESFSGKGSFKGWLCRIAYTQFLQSYRKRKSTAKALEKLTAHTEIQNQKPANWDSGDAMDLDRALGQLPQVERSLIVLCYSSGMTHEEAATISGLPLGTVKSHIKRGKEKMRLMLIAAEEVIG